MSLIRFFDILLSNKAHIFLITRENFYSWYMFHLEDTGENMTSYGNHK